MARLEWSEDALLALERLRVTHTLPADTRQRIEDSAAPLARFPRLGPELRTLREGGELRFLLGPWPWLLVVYVYLEHDDRVVVVSVEDGRAATTTISEQRRMRAPKPKPQT